MDFHMNFECAWSIRGIFWCNILKQISEELSSYCQSYISSTWDIEAGELLWTQDKPGLLISS